MKTIGELQSTLNELALEIPAGIDPVLDSFRKSAAGDSSYSTSLNRQARAFSLYQSYAETGRRFLDWGCRHAWDSCMVRMVNDRASIDGCDITESMVETTKAFARMRYTHLQHAWKLPYPDDSFDRVICSGVLEHAPLLRASLFELNRVTAPDGVLVITFLPNKSSYTEFALRKLFGRGHRRLFTPRQLKTLLLEYGFEPTTIGHHQFLPSLVTGHAFVRQRWLGRVIRGLFKADPVAERLWPLKLFDANIYGIACKRTYM